MSKILSITLPLILIAGVFGCHQSVEPPKTSSKPRSETTAADSENIEDDTPVEKEETRQLFLRFTDNVAEQLTRYLESPEEWNQLFLTGSPVEDSLVGSLPVRTDIEVLDLSQTPVTQETIELIPEKFPNLRILYCDFTAVTSPTPLLGMSDIESIRFYGTLAQANQITRRDGRVVNYLARKIDRKALSAIQSLTSHNIIVSPVVFGAGRALYVKSH